MDLDGKMEKLSGQPLLELLSQFYWNVTDFDGAGQMETWKLQVELIYIFATVESNLVHSVFGREG